MEISEEKRNTGILCSYLRVASHLFECQALCDPDCGFFSVSSPALSLNNTCRRLICLAQERPRTVADATRQASRRKVIRKYDFDYLKFGFAWNSDHEDRRPQCVICYAILANESMRPNKLLRHIETKHMDLKNKPLQFFESKLKELNASQCVLPHFTNINEKAMHASYLISLRIPKSGKLHTIGESLILPLIKDAVGVMFGDTCLKEIEVIPLSDDRVARRIEDMSKWVDGQLINTLKRRYISEEIFETLDAHIKSKELKWRNSVGISTDGARAMCGKNSGVVTRVLKQSPNASWTHCSLNREALVSKTISDDLKNVLIPENHQLYEE
ncbi:SCAN domain-containing protein 3 [Trichinella zimbabwensis]|uniref:SCAN domain-containing protein 3 n=1 Tax=Trichinella zimbabwensis TaxID=268475 RepID=A0A0V1HHN1_9BILA|nr:SCAN domain-containing protein 3 [Trichinella zimbabwensis]